MTASVVVGLGELLWDLLPGGRLPGGAPANFAYHAAVLGDHGIVTSRVGTDPLGKDICACLTAQGLTTHHVQRDPHRPTGTVQVQLEADGQPRFTIAEDSAWDALAWSDDCAGLAAQADAVCFGTLAQRSAASHETIQRFLRATRPETVRLFDVNLRQHYHTPDIVDISLRRATMAKLNDVELRQVVHFLGLAVDPEAGELELARCLLQTYDLALVCLTRGARGSLLVTERQAVSHPGFPVRVVSSVGAGDAFAAAVVHHWLRGASLTVMAEAANRLGAYVATQAGGMPPVPAAVLNQVWQP